MTAIGTAVVGYWVAKRARRESRTRRSPVGPVRAYCSKLLDSIYVIGALGSCTTAAYLFNVEAGLVATGLSLLVLNFELSS